MRGHSGSIAVSAQERAAVQDARALGSEHRQAGPFVPEVQILFLLS